MKTVTHLSVLPQHNVTCLLPLARTEAVVDVWKRQECDSATVTWYAFIWNRKWYNTNINYTQLLLHPPVMLRSLLNDHTSLSWTNVQLNSDPVCLANFSFYSVFNFADTSTKCVHDTDLLFSYLVILHILLNSILCAFHWKMNFLIKFLTFFNFNRFEHKPPPVEPSRPRHLQNPRCSVGSLWRLREDRHG